MTLQEIEDKLRAWAKLDAESKHVNPLARVKAFEDCADALKAERERIEVDGVTEVPCENCSHIGHYRCCECGHVQGSKP